MEGREEQGAAPRQAPRGQGGAADPADPDDPDRRRRLAELRQRILHRMVRIILGYRAAYCRANKACGRVCPDRVSESTIEHEAHRILHEDFDYDDVADSDVESLTNLYRHLGTVPGSETIPRTPQEGHFLTPFVKEQEPEVRDCAPSGPSTPTSGSG